MMARKKLQKRSKLLSLRLPEEDVRRILNLLTEELDVWDAGSSDHEDIVLLIAWIESETGIKKRAKHKR